MKTYWIKLTRERDAEDGIAFIGFTAELSEKQANDIAQRLDDIQQENIDALPDWHIEEVKPKSYKELDRWLEESLGDLWEPDTTL